MIQAPDVRSPSTAPLCALASSPVVRVWIFFCGRRHGRAARWSDTCCLEEEDGSATPAGTACTSSSPRSRIRSSRPNLSGHLQTGRLHTTSLPPPPSSLHIFLVFLPPYLNLSPVFSFAVWRGGRIITGHLLPPPPTSLPASPVPPSPPSLFPIFYTIAPGLISPQSHLPSRSTSLIGNKKANKKAVIYVSV